MDIAVSPVQADKRAGVFKSDGCGDVHRRRHGSFHLDKGPSVSGCHAPERFERLGDVFDHLPGQAGALTLTPIQWFSDALGTFGA
jgi:hypothetical protein